MATPCPHIPPSPSGASLDSGEDGPLRVFLLDDHPEVRKGFRVLLERQGIRVCGEAADLASAREGIARTHPDLALVDLSLGAEDGKVLIRELSGQDPGVPCLAISMFEARAQVEGALQAGAVGYLAKREAPACLVQAVRACLCGLYLSPRAILAAPGWSRAPHSPRPIPDPQEHP